jgi:ABC-type glycerol-3-phosphate transport system permease component
MRRRLRFNPIKAFFMVVPLAIMLFWTLAPIYWILVTAFTTNDKLYSPVLNLFPNPITLSHFDELFRESSRRSWAARPRTPSRASSSGGVS